MYAFSESKLMIVVVFVILLPHCPVLLYYILFIILILIYSFSLLVFYYHLFIVMLPLSRLLSSSFPPFILLRSYSKLYVNAIFQISYGRCEHYHPQPLLSSNSFDFQNILIRSLSHQISPIPITFNTFITPTIIINYYENEHFISCLQISKRFFSKNRDRKKEKKSSKSVEKPNVILDDDEMESVLEYEEFKNEVEMIIDQMKNDLMLNYNLRINPKLVEK